MSIEERLETNMERIKELTDELEYPFANTIHSVTAEEIKFKMDKGELSAYRMKGNEYYASLLVRNTHDAEFPYHSHREREYLIILEGWVDVQRKECGIVRYGAGDVVIIPAGTVHKCSFRDGSVVMAITVPPAKEF